MNVRQVSVPSLLCLAFALAGCSHHDKAAAPANNILRYPLLARPTTFDPAMVQDGTTIDLLQNIFEGLVEWTPENKLAPAIAKSWDISKDGLTYTFHLRDDVKFQDGNAVTADDVVYSFKRSLDPKLQSPVAITYMGNIVGAEEFSKGKAPDLDGVKAVDPRTVTVRIKKPGLYWIYTLTYPTSYIVSKAEAKLGTEMKADDVLKGAGTGPFKLASYNPDQDVKIVANAAYYEGAPKLAGITRPIVTDSNTRYSMYQQNELDIVDEQRGSIEADLKNPDLKDQVKFWPRAATFYVGLNQLQVSAFKDVRVRQALAYATDKKQIQAIALGGRLDIAQDFLPEGIPGFDPSFQGLPYDPAKAKALLAAAGYPNGEGFPTIPITYRESYPELESAVNLLREQWQENLGVKIDGRRSEWGVMLAQQDKNALPAYMIRWAADYLDPQDYYSTLLRTGASENHVGYSNPTFDALCDSADTDQDPVRRNATYRKAAAIARDEVPVIPLWYQKDTELVKPWVRGLDDGLMGHLPHKHTYIQQ